MDETWSTSNIKDTSNGTSDIDVVSSSNGLISAVRSKVNILGCSNFKVGGQDHRQVSLNSCSNVNLDGSKGCLQINDSSNTKVTGDNNQVKVDCTSNLVVKGDGNKLELKDISNHILQPSQAKDMNVFEVKTAASSMIGWLASFIPSNSITANSKKFNVEYVETAMLTGPEYKLGIYNFKVDSSSPFYVDVVVDPSRVNGLHTIPNTDSSSIQLEGQNQEGLVQKLVLKGPRVTQTEENSFRIDLNNQQSAL